MVMPSNPDAIPDAPRAPVASLADLPDSTYYEPAKPARRSLATRKADLARAASERADRLQAEADRALCRDLAIVELQQVMRELRKPEARRDHKALGESFERAGELIAKSMPAVEP